MLSRVPMLELIALIVVYSTAILTCGELQNSRDESSISRQEVWTTRQRAIDFMRSEAPELLEEFYPNEVK